MTKLIFLLILVGVLLMLPFSKGIAQEKTNAPDPAEMKTYFMVFLKAGPNRTQSPEEAAKIQEAHLGHIKAMAEAGKLAIAGPFLDDFEVKGIFILNVETLEEAQKLTEADPAVKAGRLVLEIHPWYGKKGACLPE